MVNHKLIRLPPIFAPKGGKKKKWCTKIPHIASFRTDSAMAQTFIELYWAACFAPTWYSGSCLREPPERLAVPLWPVACLCSVLPSAFLLCTSGDESGAAAAPAASSSCTQQSCAGAGESLWPSGDRQVMEPIPASSKSWGKKNHAGAQGCSAPPTLTLPECSRRRPPGAVNK